MSSYIEGSLTRTPDGADVVANLHSRVRTLEALPALGHYEIKVSSDDPLEPPMDAGDSKFVWMVPADLSTFVLTETQAFVSNPSSAGVITVQIRRMRTAQPDVDMLSTPITIDVGELTSYTAATPRVINLASNQVLTGDLLAIDLDVTGTDMRGLGVIVVFAAP